MSNSDPASISRTNPRHRRPTCGGYTWAGSRPTRCACPGAFSTQVAYRPQQSAPRRRTAWQMSGLAVGGLVFWPACVLTPRSHSRWLCAPHQASQFVIRAWHKAARDKTVIYWHPGASCHGHGNSTVDARIAGRPIVGSRVSLEASTRNVPAIHTAGQCGIPHACHSPRCHNR